MDYNAAKVYVFVVEQGSFSGAAKVLSMPVSTVSRKVSELEASLELRLLERSTRQLRLTEAGEVFYEYAKRSMEEAELGVLALQNTQQNLQGTLRISLPIGFEPIWSILDDFQVKYPGVNIEVRCYPGRVDFINDGVDVALVTYPIHNPNYIVRDLGGVPRVIVASPEYITKNGAPCSPDELAQYQCLSFGDINQDITWELEGKHYPITPYFKTNSFRQLKYSVLQGRGIGNLPPSLCQAEIESGELIALFETNAGAEVRFRLVYPSKRLLSSITRAYIEHCIEAVKANPKHWLSMVSKR